MKLIHWISSLLGHQVGEEKERRDKSKNNSHSTTLTTRVPIGSARKIVRGGPPGVPEWTFRKATPSP